MCFQILVLTPGTRPMEALPDFGVQKMAQRTTPPSFLFGLFQDTPLKSETTFVYQLSILIHKCGLRFFARSSEHYAKNGLKFYYSTLTFFPIPIRFQLLFLFGFKGFGAKRCAIPIQPASRSSGQKDTSLGKTTTDLLRKPRIERVSKF